MQNIETKALAGKILRYKDLVADLESCCARPPSVSISSLCTVPVLLYSLGLSKGCWAHDARRDCGKDLPKDSGL